jgi:hypothetical protein
MRESEEQKQLRRAARARLSMAVNEARRYGVSYQSMRDLVQKTEDEETMPYCTAPGCTRRTYDVTSVWLWGEPFPQTVCDVCYDSWMEQNRVIYNPDGCDVVLPENHTVSE